MCFLFEKYNESIRIISKYLGVSKKWSNFAPVYEKRRVMDSEKPSVEELIAAVLSDIQQKGYSSIQPFDIGEVEGRMIQFAQANGVMLGSDRLY